MALSIIISAATCLAMILAVLFYPKINIGRISLGTYWVVTLVEAILLLLTGAVDPIDVSEALLAETAINPLKILVLFISMTLLSIYLDELGFFRYLASATLRRAGCRQTHLFFILYVTVSILTVFTSNDIVILSFTPFICYFAKSANISPLPYLAAEFVAANTWSMGLIIGNPTNIYLVTAAGGNFISYLATMLFPTLISGTVAFFCLYLAFHKKLSHPIDAQPEEVKIDDRISLLVGIIHLAVCTVLLAVGSNLGACLSPIGALAGIMWSSILKKHNLKFGYFDFLKIGITIAIPALVAALATLDLML